MTPAEGAGRGPGWIGDPEADAVIEDLFASGQVVSASALLQSLVRNTTPPSGEAPESLRNYLTSQRNLPEWAEPARVTAGELMFSKYGMQIGLALYCSALGEGYLHWRFAHILHLTARLETNTSRRVVETLQLILDVMAPGGLGPGGAGIATALRVRLMHAAIRYLITERAKIDPSVWDPSWGVPISQEDLVTTLMSFSVLMIDDLAMLGIKLSEEEQESYLHAWLVAGHFMGIEREFLPQSVAEGRELFQAARKAYYRPTPQGLELERALIETLGGMAPEPMHGLPVQYIRFFIGDTYAGMLQLPEVPGWRRRLFGKYVRMHRRLAWLAGESGFADSIVPFSRALLVSFSEHARGGQRPAFAIPESLREALSAPGSAN